MPESPNPCSILLDRISDLYTGAVTSSGMNAQSNKLLTESVQNRDMDTGSSSSLRESESDPESLMPQGLSVSAPTSLMASKVTTNLNNPKSDSCVVRNLGQSMDQMSDSFFDPGGSQSQSASGGTRSRELIREIGGRALETRKICVENEIDFRIQERRSVLSELDQRVLKLTSEVNSLLSTKSDFLELQENERRRALSLIHI